MGSVKGCSALVLLVLIPGSLSAAETAPVAKPPPKTTSTANQGAAASSPNRSVGQPAEGDAKLRADAIGTMNQIDQHLTQLNQVESRMVDDLTKLSALVADLDAHATKLRLAAASCASRDQVSCSGETLLAATSQMQQAQMSFNVQYLQLQAQMQQENRSYTAISNILKTKHDTVKSSISNIR